MYKKKIWHSIIISYITTKLILEFFPFLLLHGKYLISNREKLEWAYVLYTVLQKMSKVSTEMCMGERPPRFDWNVSNDVATLFPGKWVGRHFCLQWSLLSSGSKSSLTFVKCISHHGHQWCGKLILLTVQKAHGLQGVSR